MLPTDLPVDAVVLVLGAETIEVAVRLSLASVIEVALPLIVTDTALQPRHDLEHVQGIRKERRAVGPEDESQSNRLHDRGLGLGHVPPGVAVEDHADVVPVLALGLFDSFESDSYESSLSASPIPRALVAPRVETADIAQLHGDTLKDLVTDLLADGERDCVPVRGWVRSERDAVSGEDPFGSRHLRCNPRQDRHPLPSSSYVRLGLRRGAVQHGDRRARRSRDHMAQKEFRHILIRARHEDLKALRIPRISMATALERLDELRCSGVDVRGAMGFDLPLWFGAVTLAPTILMLSIMFRQGPTEHAILSPESTSQW
jgi:hypothetical protein